MSKSKKNARYLHLHRIPFILLWMSTYAMGWAGAFLVLLAVFVGFSFTEVLTGSYPSISSSTLAFITGLSVGVFTAWGQPWLVRQRSGLVLRLWRPLSILSYALAGLAFAPLIDGSNGGEIAGAHFIWFFVPAILPALSLWRIVRGAWQWVAVSAGVGVASVALWEALSPLSWDGNPFAMLFSVVGYSFLTGWLMLRLLKRSRVDAQLSATNILATEAQTDDTTRGYLHHVPYMLLWLMSQGVGWIFVIIAFLLAIMLAEMLPWLNSWLNDVSLTVVIATGALIFGVFSAWSQPWLVRLRTGKILHGWRPLTILGTTLSAFLAINLMLNEQGYIPDDTPESTVIAALGIWFIGPMLLQLPALWRAGRSAWLWLVASVSSVALAIMLMRQLVVIDSSNFVMAAFLALSFGQVTHVLLTGLVSLHILEAPQDDDDSGDVITTRNALTDASGADAATTQTLLALQNKPNPKLLKG